MTRTIAENRDLIAANAQRIADLGRWPSYIDSIVSLVERVPLEDGGKGPGFDAGLACCLDLIPRDKQQLAATLHAAYTADAVEQVRREIKMLDANSETCWWLAACSICDEGNVTATSFQVQIVQFERLVSDPAARLQAAQEEYERKMKTYWLVDDVAFGVEDGCQSAAYIAGHEFAVMFAANHSIFFIGTFHPSLGLENFQWSSRKDAQGRPMSGPVHGSKQFVKAASFTELGAVVEIAKATLFGK